MMLQVVLGASRADLRGPHEPGAAAVQESRERPAEVQQGERQVRRMVEHFSVGSRLFEGPYVRQQSASA